MALALFFLQFAHCQVVVRNALKPSLNNDKNALSSHTSSGCNIPYDQYRKTKQAPTTVHDDNEDSIPLELKSHGFIISSILRQGSKDTRNLWTKYFNNTF